MYNRVKTTQEIIAIRQSGRILSQVITKLKQDIRLGMSTKDLSEIAKKELAGTGAKPSFLGYYGYPDVLCVSINDEVVHGIPKVDKYIQSGDLVSLDFGVTYDGMITDSAITVIVGKSINKQHDQLVKNTYMSLMNGIDVVKNGIKVGKISSQIQVTLDKFNYGIVRDLVGHGVGHFLHEDPNIPNYGTDNEGPILKTGMTIAIEPMATLGGYKVKMDNDGWTIRTEDGSVAAHFEHTVLITQEGCEILTL